MLASVRERDAFHLVLSGGTTPLPAYRRLAARPDLPWDRVHLWIGDERFVPDHHPDSNFRSIREHLLHHVPVDPDRVHPWPVLETPEESARAYGGAVQRELTAKPFDLVLLGLGADGHTAGIFPGTRTVASNETAVASRPADTKHARLSLSPRRLSEARTVAFLVAGEEKRPALEALIAVEGKREASPARAIAAIERLLVLADRAAAATSV